MIGTEDTITLTTLHLAPLESKALRSAVKVALEKPETPLYPYQTEALTRILAELENGYLCR